MAPGAEHFYGGTEMGKQAGMRGRPYYLNNFIEGSNTNTLYLNCPLLFPKIPLSCHSAGLVENFPRRARLPSYLFGSG
jgi:hypothetical protein